MSNNFKFDLTDRKILRELQRDSSRTTADIAKCVHLSTNACWRRIKILEESGIIRKQVALIDQDLLGLTMTVFVQIKTNEHSEEWFEAFSRGVSRIDEVVEFHRLSGTWDYLLKVLVENIADYDRVYKMIIRAAPLSDVTSFFSMERIKETTEIPISLD
ncbi:MAG: Lrp/AsnC family transcriptional regulator [Cohaesibacteraceae bacterium]|nr:Lrp/AsnC family transcriptional regulator [Cohaesibacteraceae bacterium]